VGTPAAGPPSSSRPHGRRVTNTYPPTPNTTGIIINNPNNMLIIVLSIPLSLLSVAASWLSGGGRDDPGLNDYIGSSGTAVTIGQRMIFKGRVGVCLAALIFDGLVNPSGA
jgi:hypothetical protein